MNPFTNPFPFRNPETRSSIGEVISAITNGGGGVLHEGGVKAALHDFMEGLPPKAVAALRPVMGDSSIRGGTLRAKVGAILKRNGVPGMVLGGSSAQIVIDNWDTFHGGVNESRLVGGTDYLQAAKNALTGKGFKTDREVKYAGVNADYAKAQKRKAEGKGKSFAEACDQCMSGAVNALAKANAADLQDKGGAAGEKAHKRLHKTIAQVLKKKK